VSKVRVLVLAANPVGTDRVRIDEEVYQLESKLRSARLRDQVELIAAWAVRRRDLQDLLARHQPHVLHFSGHGTTEHGIVLQDEDGHPAPVRADVLVRILRPRAPTLRLVVLNACATKAQADAIASAIDAVVGASAEIRDDDAIEFAEQFYSRLFDGESLTDAFRDGLNQLDLENAPAAGRPVLVTRPGIDAAALGPIAVADPPVWRRVAPGLGLVVAAAIAAGVYWAGTRPPPLAVGALTFEGDFSDMNGPCPATIKYIGKADVTGRGPLTYQIYRDGTPEQAVTIPASAPSVTIHYDRIINAPDGTVVTGSTYLQILSPVVRQSEVREFRVGCTDVLGPGPPNNPPSGVLPPDVAPPP
jgi:hypothetical protein